MKAGVAGYTYRLHVRASVLEGALTGVLAINDVVARKALGATQAQIVLLTMAPAALQVLALLLAQRFDSIPRRRLFLLAGIAGRLVLFAMAAVNGPWAFLAILIAHGIVQTVLVPAQNAIYQSNYAPSERGRLFGLASTFGGLATAVSAFGAGVMLDRSPDLYRWIYPAAGIAGFGACLYFGSIRLRRQRISAIPPNQTEPTVGLALPEGPVGFFGPSPWRTLKETLGADRGFLRYEAAMMAYGMGFMCMQPVFARFFVDELHAAYTTASLAKGVVFYGVYVAALGGAGRLLDRIGLQRLGMWSAIALASFAATAAVVRTPAQAVAAFGLYGLGMAGINLVWSMGPLEFAPPRQATRYMSVHVALVGVRAIVGHPLGGAVAEFFGSSRETFVLSAAFFGSAALMMRRAARIRAESQRAS